MGYAMSLIRFVNHITEKGQNKQFAQPVHVLAEEVGIPEWMVDLRHEAAHSSLPSLNILREAADFALEWLKREYWDVQTLDKDSEADVQKPPSDSEKDRNLIKELLNKYQLERFRLMEESEYSVKMPSKSDQRELRKTLDEIETMDSSCRPLLVSSLLEDGYLISTKEELDALEIDVKEFDCDRKNIPELLISFWKPFLKMLHHLNLTPLLVQSLMTNMTERDTLRNNILGMWAYTILTASQGKKKTSLNELYKTPCGFNWKEVLDLCTQNPHCRMGYMLPSILEGFQPALTSNQKGKILKLTSLYKASQNDGESLADKIYTTEDVKNDIALKRQSIECSEKIQSADHHKQEVVKPWQKCKEPATWAEIPLGSVPGQEMTWNIFDLPESMDCSGDGSKMLQTENSESMVYEEYMEDHEHVLQTVDRSSFGHWSDENIKMLQESVTIF